MAKQYYKIRIHSVNKLSGNDVDGVYKVDLPEILDVNKNYMLAVESFLNKTYYVNPYLIICPSFSQGNTYSTLQDGSDFTLTNASGNGFTMPVDKSTIGCKLQDISFLRSKQIRLKFTDLDGVTLATNVFGLVPSWMLTLVVWECDE
jgi:hypothetical protein